MRPDEAGPLRPSLHLRYRLTISLLDAGRPLRVRELVEIAQADQVWVGGRPSKVVSDALRWEVRRGRVVRVARGVYARGSLPRSTEWWMRERLAGTCSRGPMPI